MATHFRRRRSRKPMIDLLPAVAARWGPRGIGLQQRALPRLRQLPWVAVGHVQPFGLPGASRELVPRRIPLKSLAVLISEVDEVADCHGARPNFDIANRRLSRLDRA